MRNLMTTAALAPILAALATGEADAETTIGTARTTPVLTSTIASGAADDVTISSAGSVKVTSGAAVTVDSDNDVDNAGSIAIEDANDATGILVKPGTAGDIGNSGTIALTEDYTAEDDDDDDDLDGPFATGANRNGIWVESGAAHAGAIDNSGTITIEGNQSAGIRLDGALTGDLSTSGAITVTGDNGHGVIAQDIVGDVTLRGSIAAVGENSVGAALLGDIDGALKIQGTILATGYRYTTVPADTGDLDADDLLQGGNAVQITGNVAGGIIFDTPPTTDADDDDTDQDDDGLTDSTEGTALIRSYGSAAAVLIGSGSDISIGAVGGEDSGHGLIVKGSIIGSGLYDGVDGQGLVIGGQGGAVTIAGGITVNGTVGANSADSNATGLRLGNGVQAAAIDIGGNIFAGGSALEGTSARALVIDQGATIGSITNSGSIIATALDDEKGSAVAIRDASGTVASIANSGIISAGGGKDGANIAIDLSANGSGVTITQSGASTTADPIRITGDILTGAGNDVIAISSGSLTGNISTGVGDDQLTFSGASTTTGNVGFGTGNATMALSGTSSFTGNVDFGGNASTLTLTGDSRFTGALVNSGATAVALNGGTLDISGAGGVSVGAFSAASGSILQVGINGATGTSTVLTVAGDASFAQGSLVKARFSQVSGSTGNYVIVRAGTLSGVPALASDATELPYLFKGTISGNAATGEVTLSVAAKSVSELGLSGSVAGAYSAIFAAMDNDADIAASYLAIADGATFDATLQQMLPDHAGGPFEAVSSGSRATARILSDPGGIVRTRDGRWGIWLQQVGFGSAKSVGSTASYDISGWGISSGAEYLTDIGAFGGSFAYLHASDSQSGASHAVDSDQLELAVHWRGQWGPLQGFARLSAAHIDFNGTRRFAFGDVARTAEGEWSGKLLSATAGASYEMQMGRFSLRPAVGIDYYRLKEDGYAETGGGDAFNLTVLGRTSDELTANGTMTLGYDLGSLDRRDGWARVELEGGRREIVGGSLGRTTAYFKDGDAFTLTPEDRVSGWTGRVRAMGGTDTFRIGGEFSAEEQQNHVAIALRATVHFAL
ncbi:uncharacterized protein with beta-barrel porin domain [Sphingobium fontiphilum]|uniref:Uncharacterized protein with beta-barrel porin domain n=1 Tax=Sphingobium fontiphilum TaxID=944425 RepID=A0A7W6DHY7_9SPHN|nr:autotransporter outer membrane beta-barrel domain-containing protein [Sphingobium fontiphilum]MBB3980940.1 uncharacterized protein with beta-barrel porin domain [Sphingobium fontiphilum]